MTAPAAPYESDALDPTLYVRGVAHDLFRWMRENDPVHRDERNGIWVVSKYEDVSYVERQPELFSSAKGVRPKGAGADALSIVSMDDPEHARQRRLISRGFTGARITQLMDHIRELARELVDNVAQRGECDFVDDIATPLPLIVIAEMLGLGSDDLLSFLVLLLVAGNETTRNALSGGMLALSTFPTERKKLVADFGLVNSATEEILRYVSPVISFSRTVTRDTELRGRSFA